MKVNIDIVFADAGIEKRYREKELEYECRIDDLKKAYLKDLDDLTISKENALNYIMKHNIGIDDRSCGEPMVQHRYGN